MDETKLPAGDPAGGQLSRATVRTGWDFCGVPDEAPDGASIGVGEQVIGLTLSPMGQVGAYAEYVVTDLRSVVRAPSTAGAVAASTLLMSALTASAMLETLTVAPSAR